MHVDWRAEYTSGNTAGADAISHPSSGLVLTGSANPAPIPPIGYSDALFLRTDSSGNEGCAALLSAPPVHTPDLRRTEVTLTRSALSGEDVYSPQLFPVAPQWKEACVPSLPCPCDLNHDGLVDDTDFSIFAVAYDMLDCTDPQMPPGCPSDFNSDGLVDDADFSIFVIAYDALLCP